jgi:hypothetical protein
MDRLPIMLSRRALSAPWKTHRFPLSMYGYRGGICWCSSAGKAQDDAQEKEKGIPSVDVSGDKLDPTAIRIEELEKELKHARDQLLRSYAEEENVRRIARRDVENAKAYATSSFAKAMLEVSDDLERALSVAPKEKLQSNDPSAATLMSLIQGVIFSHAFVLCEVILIDFLPLLIGGDDGQKSSKNF